MKIIAEIGWNHCGDMDLAKQMAKAEGFEEFKTSNVRKKINIPKQIKAFLNCI